MEIKHLNKAEQLAKFAAFMYSGPGHEVNFKIYDLNFQMLFLKIRIIQPFKNKFLFILHETYLDEW